MTALEIVHCVHAANPALNLAISTDGAAVGLWDSTKARYVMLAGRLIIPGPNGEEQWANCPREILVNGKPPVDDWVPVEATT